MASSDSTSLADKGQRLGLRLIAKAGGLPGLKDPSVRAKVEHPFRVIKRQFGYTKVRYRGLAKNTAQVLTLFALSNLWMKRKQLMPAMGSVRL